MRRTLIGPFALLLALVVGLGPAAAAQEASGSPTAAAALLPGLGYQDLVLTTDGTDFSLPAETAAGRYRLVVENANAQLSADVVLARPPAGMTAADAIAALEASGDEGAPELYFDLTFVGGTYAFPASTDDSIITLEPGEYVVFLSAYSETDDEAEDIEVIKSITVTGELPALDDPAAAVTVSMVEMAFEMPATIPAGPQIWQVTNGGAFPHFMVINAYPEPVTEEQIQATLNMFLGTPEATPGSALNPDDFVFVGQGQTLSPGQANWYEFDFAPGQYIAFCFVEGPGEVPIHASMGMFKIFTVA